MTTIRKFHTISGQRLKPLAFRRRKTDGAMGVRLWDCYQQQWAWHFCLSSISDRVMASLMPEERAQIREKIAFETEIAL